MISVKNLEKRYGSLRAVSGVSFEVQPGEIVGLLGHNGAGKTTVMKIMTGYLEPTAGTVVVGGVDVRTDRNGVQRQIGYLPENAPLYPEMLVQEYLLMIAELRGMPADRRVGAVGEAVRATGLEDRLVQPIGTLSKGYRQRVGLAQAIVHQPPVLVLDEPTNGLDPVQIVEIRALIRRLALKSTVILSTHILSEIEAVCNRVVVLIDGEIAADAPMKTMLASRSARVSLRREGAGSPAEIGAALKKLEGVTAVHADGERDEHLHFRLEIADGARPIPAIIRHAHDAGWTLGGVAPETPTLENVFRDLMARHVTRARGAAGPSGGESGEVAA